MQAEIQAQLTQVEQLQKKASDAEQLASLHGAAADAVAAQFRAAVAGENKKSARSALVANVMFFLAGVVASVFVTLLVRPIGS